jgi:CopG family transcriptional regulator, nickel-responsive regulator
MDKVERFGVSMPTELAEAFDGVIRREGYTNRSEAIRDIIRRYLVEEEWSDQTAEVIGTVTLVYDHHVHDLSDALTDLQHEHHDRVICSQHVHLDEHNCLETIVLRGPASKVREMADSLIGTRGVKHGRLVCTTTGSALV